MLLYAFFALRYEKYNDFLSWKNERLSHVRKVKLAALALPWWYFHLSWWSPCQIRPWWCQKFFFLSSFGDWQHKFDQSSFTFLHMLSRRGVKILSIMALEEHVQVAKLGEKFWCVRLFIGAVLDIPACTLPFFGYVTLQGLFIVPDLHIQAWRWEFVVHDKIRLNLWTVSKR